MESKNDELIVLSDDFGIIENNFGAEHDKMIKIINQNLPVMAKTTKSFYKTQSQFMDNMLTVSHPTPIRNVRQILAEVTKTMQALDEYRFNEQEKRINIKRLKKEIFEMKDFATDKALNEFDVALKENDINKLQSQLKTTLQYVSGAIRKLTNYCNQYNQILKKIGKTELTELDFENEEVEYHIKKAFEQALCAARAHGGWIDEGNQIYLTQIGINGTVAQQMMTGYLNMEAKMISDYQQLTQLRLRINNITQALTNKDLNDEEREMLEDDLIKSEKDLVKVAGARLPNHEDQLRFLDQMYKTFKECSDEYSEKKGMTTKSEEALFGGVKNDSEI